MKIVKSSFKNIRYECYLQAFSGSLSAFASINESLRSIVVLFKKLWDWETSWAVVYFTLSLILVSIL